MAALKNVISRNVRALRLKAGLTQQALADKAGIDVRYVSRLETNPQNITVANLERVAKALKVSPAALVGDGSELETTAKGLSALDDAIRSLNVLRSKLRVAADD